MTLFTWRNAFLDHADVVAHMRYEVGDLAVEPKVTIAIPTYFRPDLLLEAIDSALGQADPVPFEVLIVDNDPDPDRNAAIAATLPRVSTAAVRYFSNEKNIGMFGNWNRCIELARGEWITILNDDDLLRPHFLARTMEIIGRRPEIDGLIPHKAYYDRRTHFPDPPVGTRTKVRNMLNRIRFNWIGLARVTPRRFFFGGELGNGAGFLFRKSAAQQLGGYRSEDSPTSDMIFYLRMSIEFKLFWLYDVLADVGIGDNESQRPETLLATIRQVRELRTALAEGYVPNGWMAMHDRLTANAILDGRRLWNVELDRTELEHEFDCTLPSPSYRLVSLFRLFHGGY